MEEEKEVEEEKAEDYHDRDRETQHSETSYTISDPEIEEIESNPLAFEAFYLAASPNASAANFKYLLKRGVEAYHPYQNGNTIAHILARNEDKNSFEKLKYLVHLSPHRSNIHNNAGLTPLAIAIQCGNLPAIELFLDEGTNPDTKLGNNQTALHIACEQGNWAAVKYLLSNYCNTSQRNSQELTAADIAWSMGYLDFVALIQNESYVGHATTSQ
jgi:ankyrin repeat protein